MREDLYAVREHSDHIPRFAALPESVGAQYVPEYIHDVVPHRDEDGPHHVPLKISLAHAQELARFLSDKTGNKWAPELAPHPCPACGRDIDADDMDFCYPTGPNPRDFKLFRAGCNEHDFGCGFEVEGATVEQAIRAWNCATPPKRQPHRFYR